MSYRAMDIANYILKYCTQNGNPISNLKLQKILYFIWIEYYNKTETALYRDNICAWQLGPVVPDVYYEYCSHAGSAIRYSRDTVIGGRDEMLLDDIIQKYAAIHASTLVNLTHENGKPWSIIYRNGEGLRDVIPFSLIRRLECDGKRC